jgi:hypothetical protein
MIIDTEQLENQLETAAAVVTALQALRDATTTAQWDAFSKTPQLEALLDACCDLEYLLEQ